MVGRLQSQFGPKQATDVGVFFEGLVLGSVRSLEFNEADLCESFLRPAPNMTALATPPSTAPNSSAVAVPKPCARIRNNAPWGNGDRAAKV